MSDDGREPVDPDFAALFRDEPFTPPGAASDPQAAVLPATDAPVSSPDAEQPDRAPHMPDPAATAEPAAPVPAAAEPAAPAVPADPAADTGRLFRSQGVAGHGDTVLAVPSDRAGRLRTLDRVEPADDAPATPTADAPHDPQPPVGPAEAAVIAASAGAEAARPPVPAPGSVPATVVPTSAAGYPPDPSTEEDPTSARRSRRPRPVGAHRGRSITAGAGYLIIFGVTFVVGLLNAMIASGDIGWPTGLALLVSTVFVAVTIRPDDAAVAVISPPVAFALTAATAGQFFLGTSVNGLLNRAVVWFFDLADSWPWIIGSTVVALVIVLVRRYRR